MATTIWHNPGCGTSRNVLHVLQAASLGPKVVLYRETPPDRETLVRAIRDAGLTVREAIRRRGTPYDDMGLGNPDLSDDDLIDAMLDEPILINRPFVFTQKGVALCRPADMVFELIGGNVPADLARTNGAPLLIDREISSADPALVCALTGAGLVASDLKEAGARFFAYVTPDGTDAGHAGFARLGEDALVRSLVVPAERRGQGLAKTILPLLLRRARDAGARTAWLLTETAAPLFAGLGFKPVQREDVPECVRGTRQFAELCPASATVMRKTITL